MIAPPVAVLLSDVIDRKSGVAPYVQLRALLEALIDDNRLPPGATLPSESELSRTYKVSRTAIRNALDQLELAGRVQRTRGRRPVVARRPVVDFRLEYKTGYRRYVEPYRVRELLINRLVSPSEKLAHSLGRETGMRVVEVVATYDTEVAGDHPVAINRLWIAGDASPAIDDLVRAKRVPDFELGSGSLLMQLRERFGVELAYSLTTVVPATFSLRDSRLLGMPRGSTTLSVTSLGHDQVGRPLVLVRATPSKPHARLSFQNIY